MAGVLVPERDQGFHFKRSAMSAVLSRGSPRMGRNGASASPSSGSLINVTVAWALISAAGTHHSR